MRTLLATLLFNISIALGLVHAVALIPVTSAQNQPDLKDDLTIPPPATTQGETNNPMPDETRIEEARRDVRQLYAKELSDGTAKARAALAQRLMQDARVSEVLAVEYAMYLEAIDLAMFTGNAEVVFAAIDAIDHRFAINARAIHKLRGDAIARLAGKADGRDQAKSILDAGKALVDSLIEQELFADAFQRTGTLRQLVRKLRNTIYEYHFDADVLRWQQLQTAWRRARAPILRLKDAPDDPAANEVTGKFYCFELGWWDRGLPLLAKANNPSLKNLAQADLANPQNVDERVAVGDGWYELTFDHRDKVNPHLRKRALKWYRLSEPELRGVQKLDVTRKLERLAAYRTADEVLAQLTETQAKRIIRYRDKMFLARRSSTTFADAQAWCQSAEGELACLRDRIENKLIAQVIAEYLNSKEEYKFWVGGTREGGTTWHWVDQSPFKYQNWRSDQPNNTGGNQQFIGLKPDGSWGDEAGDAEYSYVAQWRISE